MNDMISRDEAILIVQNLLKELRGDIEIIGDPSAANRAYERLSELLEHLMETDTETPVQRVLFWCPLGHTPGKVE